MDITLSSMTPEEEIGINTGRSQYLFILTNPGRRLGLLTGGLLGEQKREAIFVGVIATREGMTKISKKFQTGARALFCLTRGKKLQWLTTSVILDLTLGNAQVTLESKLA
jgi:hypothetical protein